ncbi:hypothetical protein JCGZ_03556 [Jatropha curcas]|uniref:Aminotransferase-like plant mobile domain-containing protein n=1 Tax=Jatropha curcas TaxID=180498 RepID=A0A067LA88_JATCU|nr:hypothetical protein JCGZ_03556 [Jatropha curcas]
MKIPSKLGLIGWKGFDLIIWPPTQLGLIGFRRLQSDQWKHPKFGLMKMPSKLGLIGWKGFDLIIWPPTQLGLIGFRRLQSDQWKHPKFGLMKMPSKLGLIGFCRLQSDQWKHPKFGLMKMPSKLGLIGLKGFDLIIWPPTQLGLIGFCRLQSDQRKHPKFGLMKMPSKLGLIGLKGFDLIIWPPTQLGIPLLMQWLVENLLEGNLGNLVFLPPVRQRLEQLRDAAVEVRGAAMELRGVSVLRMPNFEQLRDATVELRDAGTEVDLGKARSGGSSTDASAFWALLDPPMRARVIAAGFGDYAAGLCRTQPHFPPAMRYALMERWNDCTHTFVFGSGEMMLTPVDYAAITGLRFTGPVAPLDAWYQTATLGTQLVRSLLGVTTQTRHTAQGCVSYEVVYRFWAERIRTRLAAWRELPVEARPAAREERDQAARSFLFYIISSQLLCTSQNKGDPAVLVCLRDLGQVWAYEYHIYPGSPSGDTPVESRQIPRYLAHCHHTYASAEDPEYWRSFLNDRLLSDLLLTPWDCHAWRTYPGHKVAELHTRSRLLMRGYWADRYYLGERVYDTPVAPAQLRVPHAPPRHM